MRKFLWIIPVLFATTFIPFADADSIPDPTTISDLGLTSETVLLPLADMITKFECCNGAKVPIHDLEITFNAPSPDLSTTLAMTARPRVWGRAR